MVKVPSGKKVFDGVINRSDVIGGILGLLENLGGIGGMAGHFTGLITNPVAPNWYTVWDEVAAAFGVDVGIIIGGLIGEAVAEDTGYSKYFRALTKFGAGKIMGNIAGSIIANSHNPGRGSGGGATQSNVWLQSRQPGTATTSGNLPKFVPSSTTRLPYQ